MSGASTAVRALRLTLLSVHVVVNAAWIGATGAMALLLLRGTPELARAAFRIHDDVVAWVSLVVVVTGALFSLFFAWGFVQFRWVALKWLLLAALGVGVVVVSAPAHSEAAALAGRAAHVDAYQAARLRALVVDAAALTLLTLLVVVSVFKPWGRSTLAARLPQPPTKLLAPLVLGAVAVVAALAIAQSLALSSVRRTPIAAGLGSIDGTATGSTPRGGGARVSVDVRGGRIVGVRVLEAPDNAPYGALARLIVDDMVAQGRIDVDAVTGATTTSRTIQLAAQDAAARLAPATP